jgi:outer membrane protein TolC
LGLPDAILPEGVQLERLDEERPEEMMPQDVEALITYARAHRPDILQSNVALKQAEAEVEVARAKFYPTLNFSATYAGEREDTGGFERDDFGNTLAFSLSYPLFAGGGNMAKLRETKEKRTEAEKNLEYLRLMVGSEVRTSIAQLQSAQKQVLLQRSNASLVQRNRDLVEKEYKAGKGTLVRLNEAQKDLISAQSRLILSLVSLRQAWFDLQTATGQSLLLFD